MFSINPTKPSLHLVSLRALIYSTLGVLKILHIAYILPSLFKIILTKVNIILPLIFKAFWKKYSWTLLNYIIV